jgi:hypothetical protein
VTLAFAKDFRAARNVAFGHVKHERVTLSLSEFFRKYHPFLLAMHNSARHMWLQQGDQFPNWGEVTAFSVVTKQPVPPVP